MHERHGRSAADLRAVEKAGRAPPIKPPAAQRDQLHHEEAEHKAQQRGQPEPIQHLDPLRSVDAGQAVVERDGGAGKPRDQRVTLAGRDAEPPGYDSPEHDGKQCRAERDKRVIRMGVKIDDIGDGGGHTRVERGHDQHAEEVERRRHENGGLRAHGARGNARGDGVGRVRPAVDQNHARGQDGGQQKR